MVPCKIMLYSYHFDKTELKITIFINFQVYHRNEKNFESSYGFGYDTKNGCEGD